MNKQIEITMPDNSKTFMTMEEIDVINKKFRTASEEQIKNWLKGNPIHVTLPYIIVGTERSFYVEGGECTPDFSCCNKDLLWDEKTRITYIERPDLNQQFRAHAIQALAASIGKTVHVITNDSHSDNTSLQ